MTGCLIALGANEGDRESQLLAALEALAGLPSTRLVQSSQLLASEPIGGPAGQGGFLNGAAVVETDMPPGELLAALLDIEDAAGRTRTEPWGPRPLDLDLLLYGEQIIDEPALRVPHPRMTFRPFVMTPAAEVAGGWRHPELAATLEEIRRTATSGSDAVRVAGGLRDLVAGVVRQLSQPMTLAEPLRSDEVWLSLTGGPISPIERPKLQVLTDQHTAPLPSTPAVWVDAGEPEQMEVHLTAALRCAWPDRGVGR